MTIGFAVQPFLTRSGINSPFLIAAFLVGCTDPTATHPEKPAGEGEPAAAIFTSAGTRGYSSISGTVRVSNREALGGGRPLVEITASRAGLLQRFTWATAANETSEFVSYTFGSLPAGVWTLRFHERHPWTSVFPVMRLSHDSTITVKVRDGRSVVLPEMSLRPVAPFLVIATEICPGVRTAPMTLDVWGDACDSGYWGGLDVEVLVTGVAGTPTEGFQKSFMIKQEVWSAELHALPTGEYDVSGFAKPRTSGARHLCSSGWQLVPWRASTQRLRVEAGLAYTEFEFWCQS